MVLVLRDFAFIYDKRARSRKYMEVHSQVHRIGRAKEERGLRIR